MTRAWILLALLSATVAAAAPAPFVGYIITTQFRCDPLCENWELDITRVDTSFRTKNLTLTLLNLLPKAPISQTNYPVFSAYHESSRTYYVVATPVT